MPKSRKTRNSKKDFQKVKFKVGKKIQKADNVTNISFHTRTIQVTQKIKTATATEPSSKRKLTAGVSIHWPRASLRGHLMLCSQISTFKDITTGQIITDYP